MAEMLVNSTKLDACLDAEADAIRAKTGGSADIPFDFANSKGFADAIAAIPTGGGGPVIEVPDGYTQMEYLESSGTQYIITPYNAKLNSRAVVKFAWLNGCPLYATAFGTRNPWFAFMTNKAITDNTPKQIAALTGFGTVNNRNCYAYSNNPIVIDTSKDGTLVDGAYTQNDASSSTLTETSTKIALFARGELNFIVPCRIWRYTYYENDVMLLDMLPAMRNSDNVLGMYDLVNNVFYTNDGTGVFTGGALS